MGDFNCRIGGVESIILSGTKQFIFPRRTQDSESKDASRGAFFVSSMNASQMVIMNGLDSGGDYTFSNSRDDSSVINFIILSDNIVTPGNDAIKRKIVI